MVDWLLVNPTAGTYDGQALTQTGPNTGVSWLRTILTVSGRTKHVEVEVIQESSVPEAAMYLTTVIKTDGTIGIIKNDASAPDLTVYYSVNEGEWKELRPKTVGVTTDVNAGDIVRWKCNTPSWTTWPPYYISNYFFGTSYFDVYGNIMSLLYGDDFMYDSYLPSRNTFGWLFRDSKVIDASRLVLPSMSLTEGCYDGMFSFSSLEIPPKILPATKLATRCYAGMFLYCLNLQEAPVLPATKMEDDCYYSMFMDCRSLTVAPELPATELAACCYYDMFFRCYSLTTVQSILPATTLATECYYGMYGVCSGITQAPMLPAPMVGGGSSGHGNYASMFSYCTSLSAVTCLATYIGNGGEVDRINTFGWLGEVSPTGVFTKSPNMSDWTRDESGIPPGWTVQDYQG